MTKQKAPEKLPNLLEKIRECIEQERYAFSKHALDRVLERKVDIPAVVHVLLNGHEEKRKTTFDHINNNWKYAIRGTTREDVIVRVIIAIDENGMAIITVIDVYGEYHE